MRTIFVFIFLFILACNSPQKTSCAKDSVQSVALDSPNTCSCKDSFYAAILNKSTIVDLLNSKHNRLRFDFYETKNNCVDSFIIEGWYQHGDASDTSIPINLLPDSNATAQSFSTPHHFRDLQLAVRNKYNSIQALLDSVGINTPLKISNCNFEIVLTPYQDPSKNIVILKAQLFYSCLHDTKNLTAGGTVTLNPCPPNKPQG